MSKELYEQTKLVVEELGEKAKLAAGDLLVVGCSTSEILGSKIGTNSDPNAAEDVFLALNDYAKERGIRLAFQCCEHLNRAVVVERDSVPGVERVNVVPQPKAGGSMATKAYAFFRDPVVVEEPAEELPQVDEIEEKVMAAFAAAPDEDKEPEEAPVEEKKDDYPEGNPFEDALGETRVINLSELKFGRNYTGEED